MCRFTAFRGRVSSLHPLVYGGKHALVRQSWAPRELLSGSVNADGWGVVWYHGGEPRRLAGLGPLWSEDDLEGVLASLESGCALAAIRNTTPGLPGDGSGVPPLTHGRWSFVLNGYVPDFRRDHMRSLRTELPDPLYGALHGSSDTETLFLLAVAASEAGAGPGDALTDVAERVLAAVGPAEAQLTMVLSDGDSVTALRTSSVTCTNSLYLAASHPALDGAALASERLEDGAVWEELPDHALIHLTDRGTEVEAV